MLKHYLLLAALALSACSTTRVLKPNAPSELAKISLRQNQSAQVTMRDGRRFMLVQLQIKSDSTRGFDGKRTVTVATADLKTITQVRRGRGALQGMAIGMLVGTIIGGIIADATYKEPEDLLCKNINGFEEFVTCIGGGFAVDVIVVGVDKSATIIAGGALGALGGGLTGALIGNAVGSKADYHFRSSELQNAELPNNSLK